MKQDEHATANQLWNAGSTEVQHLSPGGPGQRQITRPSQLNWKLHAGPIIKSEARYNWGEVEDIGDESTSNLKNLKLFLIMYSMKLLCLLSLAAQTPYNPSHFWCVKSDVIFYISRVFSFTFPVFGMML